MTDNVSKRVIDLASEVVGEPVSTTSTPSDVETWDSLAQLNLMVAIEDEFGIQLSPDDIELMSSVGAIVELVESRLS